MSQIHFKNQYMKIPQKSSLKLLFILFLLINLGEYAPQQNLPQ